MVFTPKSTFQSMMLWAIVLGVMMNLASAQTFQDSYPPTHPFCKRPGFVLVDRSAWYKNGVNVPNSICVLQYFAVCATVEGTVPCNMATHACRDVEYAWDNMSVNSASAAVMARKPQVCASRGAYAHPEVAVFAVAQPVLAFIILFICIILLIVAVHRAGALAGLWSLFTLMVISCSFLIFGVWYLNAYLAILVTITGVGMFATRERPAILIGLFCIFIALLWFTYAGGLGGQQHAYRFSDTAVERYENICNAFYKGYFASPLEFKSTFVSPAAVTRGYCMREYIAVEFFFLFFIELLFLMLFAYGGYTMVQTLHDESA